MRQLFIERSLPAVPEFRKDPVTGRWVIIAANRDQRPNQFQQQISVPVTTPCPFCADQMATPPIVARYGASRSRQWQVCVVPNLYPIVEDEAAFTISGTGLYETAYPNGVHEIIIESPTHETSMSQLTREQITFMLTAYRDRMQVMRDRGSIAVALPWKNCGPNAGASLEHSHSQLAGLPFVPPTIAEELAGASKFLQQSGECVFCSLVRQEIDADERIVAVDRDFVAWCPFASRFGFEIWIAPREHRSRFETTADWMLDKLGIFFQRIMRTLESHSQITAFNYLLHSTPFDIERDDHYHWHIEIIPRIAKAAGFEWGTGIHINAIAPEAAAIQLRVRA